MSSLEILEIYILIYISNVELLEIHHRTRNNLAIIQGLLSFQIMKVRDQQAGDFFRENQVRIRSIGLIHDRLFMSGETGSISASRYIGKLADDLFSNFQAEKGRIRLDMKLEDIALNVDTLVPCGLILNELITNTKIYAFPGDTSGTLQICL